MGSKGRQLRQAISITEVRAAWMWRASCIQDQTDHQHKQSPAWSFYSKQKGWWEMQRGLVWETFEWETGGQKLAGSFPGHLGSPLGTKGFCPIDVTQHFQQALSTQCTFLCGTEWDGKKELFKPRSLNFRSVHSMCPESHRPQELGDRLRGLKHAI